MGGHRSGITSRTMRIGGHCAKGYDLSDPDLLSNGQVPLALACERGLKEIINLLVNAGNESPTDEHLAVRLESDSINNVVGGCARIETEVKTPISVDSGDAVASGAIENGESAPDEHLAVRLKGHRVNVVVF